MVRVKCLLGRHIDDMHHAEQNSLGFVSERPRNGPREVLSDIWCHGKIGTKGCLRSYLVAIEPHMARGSKPSRAQTCNTPVVARAALQKPTYSFE